MLRGLILSWFIIFTGALNAQGVWPGDVNNNGLVNHIDLLLLAQAYGETGPPRSNQGIEWEGKIIDTPWGQNFPSGLNYAFADCNGDGVIDDDDREAIFENAIFYNPSFTHGVVMPDEFGVAMAGLSPTLYFGEPTDPTFEGVPAEIPLLFGTQDMPVEDFYGVAFTLSFESDVVETGFLPFPGIIDFEEDWFDGTMEEPIVEFFFDPEEAKTHVVISRTDQMPAPTNFGEFGSFFIVIIDDVVGWGNDEIQTELKLENIQLLNENGTSTAVFGDSLELTILNDDIVNDIEESLENYLKIFPNPVEDIVFLEMENAEILSLKLSDITGRMVKMYPNLNSQKIQLPVQNFPSGMYQLQVETTQGRLMKKIVIQ